MKAYLIIGATVFLLNGLNLVTHLVPTPVMMMIAAVIAGKLFPPPKEDS